MSKVEQAKLVSADTSFVDNVGEFRFEPIKGYPMLSWSGKRPFTFTRYYPAQIKEVYGEEIEGWRNKIYWGDNLQVMSHMLKNHRGKISLIYVDPPFDSKADYKRKVQLKGRTAQSDLSSFEDKQYTDIWTNDEYLQFIYERAVIIRELLTDNGSLAMHCDVKRSHYLKAILDEIFGQGNFRAEILVRAGVKNVQAQFDEVSNLSLGHNSILLYSKRTTTKYKRLQVLDEEFRP
jgi:adenine-specific DNA-methyltransferase